ncbi:MAG: response regulator [Actinobacteria bacterium]|nr:response regulator [Actinomycetota bacterium]
MDKIILVVDDEKNIRTTLSTFLSSLNFKVDMASNGEEALIKLKEKDYSLVLLDIKMHGLTGMQVLQEMRDSGVKTNTIMMTAYGTIENAVESMKLGAVDFISKPFTLEALKLVLTDVLDRQKLKESEVKSFKDYLEYSKKCIFEKNYEKAKEYLKKAISEDLEAPEPQNLLGVLAEFEGDLLAGGRHYRAALELDPTYKPALENLERITRFKYSKDGIQLDNKVEE